MKTESVLVIEVHLLFTGGAFLSKSQKEEERGKRGTEGGEGEGTMLQLDTMNDCF